MGSEDLVSSGRVEVVRGVVEAGRFDILSVAINQRPTSSLSPFLPKPTQSWSKTTPVQPRLIMTLVTCRTPYQSPPINPDTRCSVGTGEWLPVGKCQYVKIDRN